MISLVLRSSTRRWTQLAALLTSFERCLEATARLDGARAPREYVATTWDINQGSRLDDRLTLLERRVDREFDRLTAERLLQDLAQKQAGRADSAGAKAGA